MEPNGKKSVNITGSYNQPIEIPAGSYYLNTKARCQRIMREPLSAEAGRVHACLELATMGFHQEMAVKLDHGRKVPLTSRDIAQQTGLKVQNVSRALTELESRGLAERRGKGDSRASRFVIYSWALPRKPDSPDPKNIIARDYIENPVLPPSWRPLLVVAKRLKIELDVENVIASADTIAEGEKLARDYIALQNIIARFLKTNRARLVHIRKKDRKDRTTKDTHTPPTPLSVPVAPSTAEAGIVCAPPLSPPSQEEKSQPQPPKEPAAHIPPNGFTRLDEFLRRYPDRSDPLGLRFAYGKANTPASEDACHACLDRYLQSDQVHRGIVMRGDRWLREQKRNDWAGEWTRVRNGSTLDQRAEDYARRRKEEKARAHR